jgi:pimeloyl-ACP methyl ester carboxylesterase
MRHKVELIDFGDVALSLRRWLQAGESGGIEFVLVHGLASNASTWDRVAAGLAERGHPVTSFDQRGHGRSGKPDGPYDMTTVTGDLDRLLSALHLHDVVLAGQSWGGNVVLEYAWRHPERLRGLVCVDGGTIDLRSVWPRWEDCRAALTPPRLAGMRVEEFERMLRDAHPSWDDEAIAATAANMEVLPGGTIQPRLTLEHHLLILRALWEHRPGERYRELRVPVLLVPADTGDATATARKREEVARAEAAIPRVRVRWLKGDHDLHVQYPARLTEVMLDALRWFQTGTDGRLPDTLGS